MAIGAAVESTRVAGGEGGFCPPLSLGRALREGNEVANHRGSVARVRSQSVAAAFCIRFLSLSLFLEPLSVRCLCRVRAELLEFFTPSHPPETAFLLGQINNCVVICTSAAPGGSALGAGISVYEATDAGTVVLGSVDMASSLSLSEVICAHSSCSTYGDLPLCQQQLHQKVDPLN